MWSVESDHQLSTIHHQLSRMLEVENLHVSYGAIKALHGVSLKVPTGSIVTLIGANGAGKSTTLRALSGLVKPAQGVIRYDGHDIARMPAHKIVSRGLCHVPEGRMVFANLTVKENLRMGAYLQKDRKWIAEQTDYVFGLFPRLKERESQAAGTLSGGEQQMLAIGRALLSKPQFLMLDEPSLGIAPLLVKAIFERIVEINREQGLTILLVEQNANLALEISSYGYVLETGKVLLEGPSAELRANPKVQAAYLGA
jgi:branched-chain amino acid transport system ATP-binding protein